jgi:hypothetical protein
MTGRIRRGIVVSGVIASLLLGLFSIRVAADLAAAAAPPPAPPISLQALKDQLVAEQDRAASLQQQLEDLLGVTDQLTTALDSTKSQVKDDGSTAAELKDRLKAAKSKLALVNGLLEKAKARLAALGAATKGLSSGGSSGKSKSGGGGGGGATATPAPAPAGTFTLTLAVSGAGVKATWTTCTASNFYEYVLVRSTDHEIHYPPEDHDSVVARVSSVATTSATDAAAPSGTLTYRLYCRTRREDETRTSQTTAAVQITVP